MPPSAIQLCRMSDGAVGSSLGERAQRHRLPTPAAWAGTIVTARCRVVKVLERDVLEPSSDTKSVPASSRGFVRLVLERIMLAQFAKGELHQLLDLRTLTWKGT